MQSNYHNLPMVNGVPQQFGSEFKATDVHFDPRRMYFSANIATAYPAEANVKKWVRSYQLGKNSLKIEDSFSLNKADKPNQVNFLTWGKVDVSVPGVATVEVNGEKVRMTYNKSSFTPTVETIRLDDPRLSNVWGEQVYRISLNANKQPLSGSYTYTITTIK